MVVIVVIGVILIATAGANAIAARRNRNDALLRHERALAALRELSAHPDPQRSVPPSAPPLTDHVRILSEPPEGAAAQRRRTQRAASRRATVRRRPRDIEGRPTAAQLPTQVGNPAPLRAR